MVGTAKQTKRNGYTIQVAENYYDTESERIIPKIYLTFPSIDDFNKLKDRAPQPFKTLCPSTALDHRLSRRGCHY